MAYFDDNSSSKSYCDMDDNKIQQRRRKNDDSSTALGTRQLNQNDSAMAFDGESGGLNYNESLTMEIRKDGIRESINEEEEDNNLNGTNEKYN